jgi:hypothetical protein
MTISVAIETFYTDHTSTAMKVLNKKPRSESEPNSKHAISPEGENPGGFWLTRLGSVPHRMNTRTVLTLFHEAPWILE